MIGGKIFRGVERGCVALCHGFVDQRARIYLVWYLLSILVFAAIYCALPGNSFYAPLISREPRTAADTRAFRQFLSGKMQDSAQAWIDSNYVDFNMADVSIARVDAAQGQGAIRFTITAKNNQITGGKPQQDLTLEIAKNGKPYGGGFCHEVRVAQDGVATDPDPYLLDVLFHDKPGCGAAHFLALDPDEQKFFRNYALGVSGQSSRTGGYGLRMITFSAMTISTTSFGDIVPLTRRARMATAIEPLWGIFLLGLALRAVVRKAIQGASAGQ